MSRHKQSLGHVEIVLFDASGYLDNEEVIAEYLTAVLEDENPDVFLTAVIYKLASSIQSGK